MHDPVTWPQQAQMADDSAWEDLKKYQKSLLQKQAIKAQRKQASEKKKSTQSKTNKKVSRLTAISKKDDLRKIEGIGPKIQELLNNAGITTFKALSKKSRDAIKKLLMEAGPQFRMHEPESWPQQAKLASKGDWDALKEYQEFLRNGPK